MKIPIWMVALGIAGIAASGLGCSGGGGGGGDDDDDGGTLNTGTYLISGGATASDACESLGNLADLDGTEVNVTVSGVVVTLEDLFSAPLDHDLVGTTFTYTEEVEYPWDDPTFATGEGLSQAYGCHEVDMIEYTGEIGTPTSFTYTMSVMYTVSSGDPALCTASNTSAYGTTFSVPCASEGSFDAAL